MKTNPRRVWAVVPHPGFDIMAIGPLNHQPHSLRQALAIIRLIPEELYVVVNLVAATEPWDVLEKLSAETDSIADAAIIFAENLKGKAEDFYDSLSAEY